MSEGAEAPPSPPLPPGLTKRVQDEWDELFSDLPPQIGPSDYASLRRLFEYRDELARLQSKWRKLPYDQRITAGSNNRSAVRNHPWADRQRHLEELVRALEDRLGLNPAARVRLHVEQSQAQLTWQQVAGLQQAQGGDPDGGVRAIEPASTNAGGDAGGDPLELAHPDVLDALDLPE